MIDIDTTQALYDAWLRGEGSQAAMSRAALDAIGPHLAEIRRLRMALARHGKHDVDCASLLQSTDLVPGTLAFRVEACSCGFAKELE